MTIYISHSRDFDYKNELYVPLRNSALHKNHTIILPHETSDMPYETKKLFASGKCDLVIAECSYPSTGQGIELGWATMYNITVLCIYKEDAKISGSLKVISDYFIAYENKEDLLKKMSETLASF